MSKAEEVHNFLNRPGAPKRLVIGGYRFEFVGATFEGNTVELVGLQVFKGNRLLSVNVPVRWTNPPVHHPDEQGEMDVGGRGRFRRDPGAVIVLDLLRLAQAADQ